MAAKQPVKQVQPQPQPSPVVVPKPAPKIEIPANRYKITFKDGSIAYVKPQIAELYLKKMNKPGYRGNIKKVEKG